MDHGAIRTTLFFLHMSFMVLFIALVWIHVPAVLKHETWGQNTVATTADTRTSH